MEDMMQSVSTRMHSELEEKIRMLNDYVLDQAEDPQQIIQIRIHQLALSRILVDVHKRPLFLLVQAHKNLGCGYLESNLFLQAIDHFSSALKLNASLIGSMEEAQNNQIFLQVLLGKAKLEKGSVLAAMKLLEKSLKANESLTGESDPSNIPILIEISKAYSKRNQIKKAIHCLQTVLSISLIHFSPIDESLITIYSQLATLYHKDNDTENATVFENKASELASELNNLSP